MTTETKHTPGPWSMKKLTTDYGYGYGQTDIFVDIGNDELIRIGTHDSPQNAYYEDVARLIACAPELLEALEEVTNSWCKKYCGARQAIQRNEGCGRCWVRKHLELIARAKGGTP